MTLASFHLKLVRQGYKRVKTFKLGGKQHFDYERIFNNGLLRRRITPVGGGKRASLFYHSHFWNFPRLKRVNKKFGDLIERGKKLKKIVGQGKSVWDIKQMLRKLQSEETLYMKKMRKAKIAEISRLLRELRSETRLSPAVIEKRSQIIQLLSEIKNPPRYQPLDNCCKQHKQFLHSLSELRKIRETYRELIENIVMSNEPLSTYWDLSSDDAGIKNRLHIARFALYCEDSHSLIQRVGHPRETQSLNDDEQKIAEKMRQKGWGTERGSIRFITEEFRERNLPSGKKKPATTIQNLKRHFRRKGLIRRK